MSTVHIHIDEALRRTGHTTRAQFHNWKQRIKARFGIIVRGRPNSVNEADLEAALKAAEQGRGYEPPVTSEKAQARKNRHLRQIAGRARA
jgi:hypothetical protein